MPPYGQPGFGNPNAQNGQSPNWQNPYYQPNGYQTPPYNGTQPPNQYGQAQGWGWQPPDAAESANQQSSDFVKYCPDCGAPLQKDDMFCLKCGKPQ